MLRAVCVLFLPILFATVLLRLLDSFDDVMELSSQPSASEMVEWCQDQFYHRGKDGMPADIAAQCQTIIENSQDKSYARFREAVKKSPL